MSGAPPRSQWRFRDSISRRPGPLPSPPDWHMPASDEIEMSAVPNLLTRSGLDQQQKVDDAHDISRDTTDSGAFAKPGPSGPGDCKSHFSKIRPLLGAVNLRSPSWLGSSALQGREDVNTNNLPCAECPLTTPARDLSVNSVSTVSGRYAAIIPGRGVTVARLVRPRARYVRSLSLHFRDR